MTKTSKAPKATAATPPKPRLTPEQKLAKAARSAINAYANAASGVFDKFTPEDVAATAMAELERRRNEALKALLGDEHKQNTFGMWSDNNYKRIVESQITTLVRTQFETRTAKWFSENMDAITKQFEDRLPALAEQAIKNALWDLRSVAEKAVKEQLTEVTRKFVADSITAAIRMPEEPSDADQA